MDTMLSTIRRRNQRRDRWLKFRRGLGRVLLVLLLLCAVLYCFEFYRCSRYTPTGDELFDRYARALIRREAPKLWFGNPYIRCEYKPHLPDSQLAEWVGEFGDDPRYWQLRYWNAQERTNSSLLQQGYERGAKDALLVLLLVQAHQEDCHLQEYELMHPIREPCSPETAAKFETERQETITAIRQATIAEVEPLYDEAIALAPEQAWPHYMRGLCNLEQGNYPQAEADFAAGNAAPCNEALEIYPESHIHEKLLADYSIPNASLYGVLCSPLRQYMGLEQSCIYCKVQDLVSLAQQNGFSGLHTEVQRAMCRFALADKAPEHVARTSMSVYHKLVGKALDNLALEPEQRMTLLYALTIPRDALRLTWVQADIAVATSPNAKWVLGGFSYGTRAANPRDKPGLRAMVSWWFPYDYYRDLAWIERTNAESSSDFLYRGAKQLERLDYATMEWPEE